MVLENNFDRGDELDADKVGVDLAQKAGYMAASLGDFLERLDERNKNQAERNGLFASHPETKERIDKIRKQAAVLDRHAPSCEPRFKSNVKYQVTPLDAIAVGKDAAGLDAAASREQGRAQEEGIRPRQHEADRRAGEQEHASVRLRRRPRTRRGPRGQGRQQSRRS